MLERIDELRKQAEADLASAGTAEQLEACRVKYLGGRGALKDLMALLKQVPAEQKPAFGQGANALREWLTAAVESRQAALGVAAARPAGPLVDVTEPGLPPTLGRAHVLTQTIDGLLDVFGRMGFDVATGPEIEDEYHNFVALNIPASHPARDPLDNFYLAGTKQAIAAMRSAAASASGRESGGEPQYMLRSQTSTIQIRVMERTRPPVRVVATGRVYRPDEHDATHYSMFHQIEGLYVDRGVSMADLKTTLLQFVRAYFGADAEVRLRPSYFPFTEPSAEMEVKMTVAGKTRWVEIGGCGMVDPAVFRHVGYDPEEWTGFAFGLGIERLAMRKYGIPDIRWLFENDVRFLRQF